MNFAHNYFVREPALAQLCGKPDRAGLIINRNVKSKFDRFYLDEINEIKRGIDGQDHNKLRLYQTLKGSFNPVWTDPLEH